ncbi:MAG: hypothetical protein PHC29_06795 [Candidatus Omnitrophica bacterium]|nr:hypothetical protein [Candidatus Omnitrophota bacterium]
MRRTRSKRALFSVYDTHGVEEFARDLIKAGWEILASKETIAVLSSCGLPVTDIADFTGVKEDYGFPPTLHPRIEHCLTGNDPNQKIDLVYIINYPLSLGNDVGGRTILALAAKGGRLPVMSLVDMAEVVKQIKQNGEVSDCMRRKLLDKTNALISKHYISLVKQKDQYDAIFGQVVRSLVNGENPYQVPADMFKTESQDQLALPNFRHISGESVCFTNLADCDSLIQTIVFCSQAFKLNRNRIPYICVAAKHGNPCGLAVSWDDPGETIRRALFANPRAIWGGELVINFRVTGKIAKLLFESSERKKLLGSPFWMLDVIMATGFSPEAIKTLGKRNQRKLFENPHLANPSISIEKYVYRFVRGGFLRQPPANYVLDLRNTEFIGKKLSEQEKDSLIVAWSVAYSSNHGGNEVSLASKRSLISCAGGPSTLEAVQLAIHKAEYLGKSLKSAVFAADAFFPFTDAPQLLIKAGVSAGVVPSGGKLFKKVKTYFWNNNASMFYLPEQYRGFCRH